MFFLFLADTAILVMIVVGLLCLYSRILYASWRQKRKHRTMFQGSVLTNVPSRQNSVTDSVNLELAQSRSIRTLSSSLSNPGDPPMRTTVRCISVMDWFKNARYVFVMILALLICWTTYLISFLVDLAYHQHESYKDFVSVNKVLKYL